jgi:hypothetical protein
MTCATTDGMAARLLCPSGHPQALRDTTALPFA